MHGKQPLTSIEAFALALVEASSRLGSDEEPIIADGSTAPLPRDDETAPAAE